MRLEIDIESDVKECCICGTPTGVGASAHVRFERGVFTEGYKQESRTVDSKPVCHSCVLRWDKLSRDIGRAAEPEEFVIWCLDQARRKTLFGESLSRKDTSVFKAISVSGVVYMDFIQVLFDGLGKSVEIQCPNCGENCHSFVLTKNTPLRDLSLRDQCKLANLTPGKDTYDLTVEDLVVLTEAQVKSVMGMGATTIKKIKSDLAEYGLHLGMSSEEIDEIPASTHSR